MYIINSVDVRGKVHQRMRDNARSTPIDCPVGGQRVSCAYSTL